MVHIPFHRPSAGEEPLNVRGMPMSRPSNNCSDRVRFWVPVVLCSYTKVAVHECVGRCNRVSSEPSHFRPSWYDVRKTVINSMLNGDCELSIASVYCSHPRRGTPITSSKLSEPWKELGHGIAIARNRLLVGPPREGRGDMFDGAGSSVKSVTLHWHSDRARSRGGSRKNYPAGRRNPAFYIVTMVLQDIQYGHDCFLDGLECAARELIDGAVYFGQQGTPPVIKEPVPTVFSRPCVSLR